MKPRTRRILAATAIMISITWLPIPVAAATVPGQAPVQAASTK